MTTQWHPVFARLLRPLVETHYEIQLDAPVGDLPRQADILLLRRTSAGALPFQGMWANLTTWNVLEFKGPTVSPRVRDLDLLMELGLGIDRRLNEERLRQRQPILDRQEVSFWYVANRLGRRFLRDARQLLGPLEPRGGGIWRCSMFQRMIWLISSVELPIEADSVPLHLIGQQPPETAQALARFLVDQPLLWHLFGGYLATYQRLAWEEVQAMANTKKKKFEPDWEPLLNAIREDKTGKLLKLLLEGVEEREWDDIVARLSPAARDKLRRRLQ